MIGYKHFEKISDSLGKDLLIEFVNNIIKYSPSFPSERESITDEKLFNNCNRELTSTGRVIHCSFTFSETGQSNKWYEFASRLL